MTEERTIDTDVSVGVEDENAVESDVEVGSDDDRDVDIQTGGIDVDVEQPKPEEVA